MPKTSSFLKLVANPGQRDELLGALRDALPAAQEEEGTEIYSFHLDRSDDNAVWIFELYTNDDALAAHSSSDALKTLLAALPPLLGEPPLMVFATPDAAKGFEV